MKDNAYDNAIRAYENMNLIEKLKLSDLAATMLKQSSVSFETSTLATNGFCLSTDRLSTHGDGGEYYVYLWKHALSNKVFYVGSGKGDRWTMKFGRSDAFYKEIDFGDAVVYKIADCLSEKEARQYEQYASISLSLAEFKLSNKDNNVELKSDKSTERGIKRNDELSNAEFTKLFEDAMINIVGDIPKIDYEIVENFRKKYGRNYFSNGK